ncbi:AbrB/MazE/SpoVT family DNA-binding domain-containing protein [Sphingosinicellaceae bacterium]|nr:AbrB/MazE/SpoVT family DNA-binding domain-containing protein [Sphingosinicellaceae bacterium]
MAALETKTFVSGNSVALRLPKALGIGPDVAMRIERRGNVLTVVPVHDPAEERRKVIELVEALRALGPIGDVEVREPIEFPDRPGL